MLRIRAIGGELRPETVPRQRQLDPLDVDGVPVDLLRAGLQPRDPGIAGRGAEGVEAREFAGVMVGNTGCGERLEE